MNNPFDLIRAIATLLVLTVGSYAYLLAVLGRRKKVVNAGNSSPLFFVILVPCLNEAPVIARTLESLSALRGRYHIAVLDDASDDGSQGVVRGFPHWLVTLVERGGLDARVGKGAALNQGYREVLRWRADYLYGPENVIVVVFDADSRIPADFLDKVTPYFSDPRVIGVQSAVRMYNADRNWLTYWQSLEFIVWARIFSRAKDILGSATLGGNGQCVRLSALMSLGAAPWNPSLTEDLELSLRLILNGGRIRFCGDTFVAQEAVPHVLQLIRQRARWIQGHLVTWEHLPAIARSSAPLRVRLDLLVLLLMPAALLPLALATVDGWRTFLASLGTLSLEPLLAWYMLAFASAPLTVWALMRDGGVDKRRAVIQAHLFLAYSMFWMVAAGRAVWSIIRGDRAWAKTSRSPDSIAQAGTIEQIKAVAAISERSSNRVPLGGLRRLGGFGNVAAMAMMAGSFVIVLIAAGLVARTYQAVTSEGARALGGDVAGITGRPAPVPSFLEPTDMVTSETSSPTPTVPPTPAAAPSAQTTPAPRPTRTRDPVVSRIAETFPELIACPMRSNCYIYVVRPGDNFFSIVRYYRVDYDTVLGMNPSLGNPAFIRAGERLRLPTPRRR